MTNWVKVCAADAIDAEDLIMWEHGGRAFAVYNTDQGFFATDGLCTHQGYPLEDGIVIGTVIECPLHGGRFDVTSGEALSAPVCEDLKTYPVKVEDDTIFIFVD